MLIAFVIYPGFTVLDVVGPFQTLADIPGHECVFVAAEAGPVWDHTGQVQVVAAKSLDEVPSPDIVVVSGGDAEDTDKRIVDWLQQVHETTTWTTSVCTGALYLATAGLLDGLEATTHWAWADKLEEFGAHYIEKRVVEQGKIITAAGVSSGIDMGLTLLDCMYGPLIAQASQLAIEYDPQPPFDAGSVTKAPSEVVDLVRSLLGPGKAAEARAASEAVLDKT